MPLDDDSFNQGFVYESPEELTDFLVDHMSTEDWSKEQAGAFFEKIKFGKST